MALSDREEFYRDLGRYFRAAQIHPSTLVRRWSSIERYCDGRRQEGATVKQIAAGLGLIEEGKA